MRRQTPIKSFKFGWRNIEYYDHDFPPFGDDMSPQYFMEEDLKIIEKYMNLQVGDVFLDVGAAFGSWSLPALMQGANVIAFEPQPIIAMCAIENVRLNSWETRFEMINAVVWGNDTSLVPYNFFTISSFDQFVGESYVEPVYIHSVTLDSMNLDRIDLIKIDVEGAEKEVLKGAQKTLKRLHPTIILENHINLCGEVEIEGYQKRMIEDGKFIFN